MLKDHFHKSDFVNSNKNIHLLTQIIHLFVSFHDNGKYKSQNFQRNKLSFLIELLTKIVENILIVIRVNIEFHEL